MKNPTLKQFSIWTFGLIFTLITHWVQAQNMGVVSYVFTGTDGQTLINAGQSGDGSLTLTGNYAQHNNDPSSVYGLNMKVDGEIAINVPGSCTVRFLGSKYSGLNMEGTANTSGDLGTLDTKVVNDLSDTYEFVYSGTAATLTFKLLAGSGNDLYLPSIDVIPAQAGKDFSSAEKNIAYYFDLRDESIYTSGAGNHVEAGLIVIDAGCCNGISLNGSQHGITFKDQNTITLQVAGNTKIRVAGDQYSGGTITATSSTGAFDIVTQNHQTSITYPQGADGGPWVDFTYVGDAGTVVLTGGESTNYLPYIELSPIPYPVTLSSYVQKSGKITVNGVEIDLSTGATSADNATITLSEGIVFNSNVDNGWIALDLGGVDPETLTPTVSGDIGSATISGSDMTVTFSDQNTDPKSFTIKLFDNSIKHDVVTYDFTGTDGQTIINAGQNGDGSLVLGGNYSQHNNDPGSAYGLNMKTDATITLSVAGSSTIQFLGSKYSSLNMKGTLATDGDLGKVSAVVTNDLSDTYELVYSGPAATLTFQAVQVGGSGSDIYLPKIMVIPSQMGGAYAQADKNVSYFFDFRDQSLVNQSDPGNTTIEKGLFKIQKGSSNSYGYHGTQHGLTVNDGNIITLQVAGNTKIRVAGDQYSGGSINASSTTGSFDVSTQSHATSVTYPQGDDGGPWVDFTYVGTAGTVDLTISGSTTYIPYIELSPIPFAVNLTPWVVKTGTISVNGTDISYTAGADNTTNPTVTVSAGTVMSATPDEASVQIDLGGNALDTFTPTFTGDIASASVDGSALIVTFTDSDSDPKTYRINVSDNSQIVTAEPGITYTYSFADGSEVPQTSYQSLRYASFVTSDGIVTINSNTEDEAGKWGYHDATHGLVMFSGNSMDMIVAGDATVTFVVCTYGSATDATWDFKDESGNALGSIAAQNIGEGDAHAVSFTYKGPAGKITADLMSSEFPTAEIYIHGLSIANAAEIEPSNGKIDVWDFGAEQFDGETYNNHLSEEIINGWYDAEITAGSAGNVLPNFNAGVLSWTGGGNDRLRTTNTNLTRYDENTSGATDFTGRVYVNSSGATGRYIGLNLSEDDEVSIWALSQSGGGKIHFEYVEDPSMQTDILPAGLTVSELKFVAKYKGTYHIYDNSDKPSYYRVYRKDAEYISLTGAIDLTEATGIPGNYSINFTNEAGKTWNVIPSDGAYSVALPAGYNYELSLADANAFIISSGAMLDVTSSSATHDIAIKQVELYTYSGNIVGLGKGIANLALKFSPDEGAEKIFIPEPAIDFAKSTFSVQLEPNVEYTIHAKGVNDFEIPANTVTIGNADQTGDITFAAKPTYTVTINANGLTTEQIGKMNITFTNLGEPEYSYAFTDISAIALRDGTYTLLVEGLDDYPLQLALTSNLTVDGTDVSKSLDFSPIHNWPFDDKVIDGSTPSYKGLLFTGGVKNEIAKGHLSCGSGQTIEVPVNPGEKVIVTYYYAADFSIDGGTAITTSSGSTSQLETAEFVYTGTEAGHVNITINATTYITNISTSQVVAYAATLTVGADKQFQTINEALNAVKQMNRPNDERVTIMIDPGNYEEMLMIDVKNVSLKNASSTPSIGLLNKGVDIDDHAVRVTAYYGHGYNYYSMGSDQKWHADILAVNKDNGYLSYENKGAGTTNGSYWNATVVVTASGFEADHIIFENSFNQYISKKESEDIVVMWEAGSKGERPKDYGNTAVQDRSFVERAAAIAYTGSADRSILNNCRIVGRQDSFYGSEGARVAVYRGEMMGAVDYIFGGMTAVFYKSNLVMNVSDVSGDASYLTAAQQGSSRGYLMYECAVTAPIPGVESASQYMAKPGYFGRPWQATTSEVVFFNTIIGTTDYPGSEGKSLIEPLGWQNTLGGESTKMYEYGSMELSGEDNSASRASWATLLTNPQLNDGTDITLFNFTKGGDDWDPFATLVGNDQTITFNAISEKTYGDVFTLDATASSSLEVSYEIVSGPAELNGNEVTVSGVGTVVIRASQVGDATFEPAERVEQSFDAVKATITATVANETITIGDDIPAFSITYSGFKLSDDEGKLEELPVATTTATASSAAGTYDITLSDGSDESYDFEYVNGTLTINKKDQTITFDALENKVYGDVFTLSASSSSSLDISYEVVSGSATVSGSEVTVIGAGSITIKATQGGDDTFNAATDAEQTFIADKATLTVTAADASMRKGEVLPDFTLSYAGFLFSDTEADIDTAPAATTTATSTSSAGTYDITVSGGSDDNYDFTYVSGQLTIEEILGTGQFKFSIYPNPASDIINVDGQFAELRIIDLNGRVLSRSNSNQVDISHLNAGIMFIQLTDSNGKILNQQRIIKK